MFIKRKVDVILVLFITVVFLFGCKKGNEVTLEEHNNPPNSSVSYEIAPWVKNIPQETFKKLTDYDSNGQLTFNSTSKKLTELKYGEIIVSPPCEKAPYGYIKRVISVEKKSSTTVIQTEDAPLTDVFTSLDINIENALTPADLIDESRIKNCLSSDMDLFDKSFDEELYNLHNIIITTSGRFSIAPSLIFNLKIANHKVEYLDVKYIIVNSAEIKLSVNGAINITPDEKTIAKYKFHPIVFWAGYVPIVFVPKISVNAAAVVNVNINTNTSISQSIEMETGIEYIEHSFNPYSNITKSFNFDPPHLDGTANFKAYIKPQLEFLLYNYIGPYVNIIGYSDLIANVNSNPWWILYGGLDLNVGINTSAISDDLEDFEKNILNYKIILAEAENNVTGTIEGIVKDAISQNGLSNVEINIVNSDGFVVTTGNTNNYGNYSIITSCGNNYKVVFSKDGYLDVEYNNIDISEGDLIQLEPVLQIDNNYGGIGTISGHILNALNGLGVNNITLYLRSGINNTSGNIIATTNTTTDNGDYSFPNIEAGNYTIETVSDDYGTTYFSVICVGNQNTTNQDATVTPNMNPGEIRIVLTWGESPSDLDSHLTGPIPNSEDRFHVYYANPEFSYGGSTYDLLDHDDISSFGPETVTIYHKTSGIYRYSVHDYSNKNSSYSTALSNSNAQVRIYSEGQLINTFYVPANSEGTLWTVFEINGNNIVPVNDMSYESNSGSITSPEYSNTDAKLISNLPKK